MKKYVGVKVVEAEPMTVAEAVNIIPDLRTGGRDSGEFGYLVKYDTGYRSWCPKQAFEEANRRIDNMTFGHALEMMRKGASVARQNWNGPDQYLEMQRPDEHSKMSLPYIYICTVQGDLVPWLCSQTDMLAEDWTIVLPHED